MSEFYDSLEDECDENKSTSGSPNEFKMGVYFESTPESESPKNYSFYLKGNSAEKEKDFQFFDKKSPNDSQTKEHFLPKIEKKLLNKGAIVSNIVIENQILYEQGLQLNNDGGITKSPRWEKEELPFILREYRKLQFEKKKLYSDNKKISSPVIQRKNIKNSEKFGDAVASKHCNAIKNKRKSCDKVISGNSVSSNSRQLKADKQIDSNYNMTDSMKEKLLQCQKDSLQKNYTKIQNYRKTGSATTSPETSNISQRNKFLFEKAGNQIKNFQTAHRFPKNSNSLEITPKLIGTPKSKIHGYISDISLTSSRPKLNYSERHKLENGFNILHLKHFIKKVQSDTNRSNFGDSVVDELPEVSTVPATSHSALEDEDEDEEIFYQKLIEKDKRLKQQNLSARSESAVPAGKLKSVIEGKRNFFKAKNTTKSKDIDLDAEVDNLVNSIKKSPHFCPPHSSTNASKIELALKRRTYGYLANARNIFRLKAQSERKLNAIGEEENVKINENNSKNTANFSRGHSSLKKMNSTSIGIFPNVKGGLPRYLEKSPRGISTLSKTKLPAVPSEIKENFTLPQVRSQKISISDIQRNK